MEVDYSKLSEQYASFLIAIAGVSITVLTLVLSLSPKINNISSNTNVFLVAALVVATISCFVGAHMMAETTAFISHSKGNQTGERLFLLASTNIFIVAALVIFALMLLPIVFLDEDKATEIKPILICAFAFVIVDVLAWMWLSVYRMPAPLKSIPIIIGFAAGIGWGIGLFFIPRRFEKSILGLSFIPIIVFTFVLLIRFAWTFDKGGKVYDLDIGLFSLAITSSCAALIVAAVRQLNFKGILINNESGNQHSDSGENYAN
jgi:hypothetical protein